MKQYIEELPKVSESYEDQLMRKLEPVVKSFGVCPTTDRILQRIRVVVTEEKERERKGTEEYNKKFAVEFKQATKNMTPTQLKEYMEVYGS
jgi:hypothetical protein